MCASLGRFLGPRFAGAAARLGGTCSTTPGGSPIATTLALWGYYIMDVCFCLFLGNDAANPRALRSFKAVDLFKAWPPQEQAGHTPSPRCGLVASGGWVGV
jgi:hypothetical protein